MKKLLATLLASTMALSAIGGLVACGGDGKSGPELKVWAPGESIATYKKLAQDFQKENPDYAKYNIKFEPVEEGTVQTQMGKDPSTGAEVFFFPSDHIYKLNKAKVLQPLTSEYEAIVKERDEQYTYEFATIEEKMYAFPATNDNGLFLLYDSTQLNAEEVKSLDTMQAKAKTLGKKIQFDHGDVYKTASFYIGTGCEFGYGDHTMTTYHTTLDSDEGRAAVKAYLKYYDPALNNGYKDDNRVLDNGDLAVGFSKGTYVAGVAGTWQWSAIKSKMEAEGKDPSKIVPTVLPDFTVDDTTYHMGSFYGAKYCGVNRQKKPEIIKASLALASYFTSETGQLARYNATFSGPSNKAAAANATIAADPRLKAYNDQKAKMGRVQYDQSGDFWSPSGFGNLAQKIATGNLKTGASDEDKQLTDEALAFKMLKALADSLEKTAN